MSVFFTPSNSSGAIDSRSPDAAQQKAQQQQNQEMNQVFSQYMAMTGQPVDSFTYSAASDILGNSLNPQEMAYQNKVSLNDQKRMVQDALGTQASFGMLDGPSLLAGMMRLNQINDAQKQVTQQTTSFYQGAIKPLDPPPKKHSDGGGE